MNDSMMSVRAESEHAAKGTRAGIGKFSIRFRSGRWHDIDVIGSVSPVLPDRPGTEALVAGE